MGSLHGGVSLCGIHGMVVIAKTETGIRYSKRRRTGDREEEESKQLESIGKSGDFERRNSTQV